MITLVAGEEVELRIKSDDTSHGFRLVGTDTNVAIPKRGKGETVGAPAPRTAGPLHLRVQPHVRRRPQLHAGQIVVRERPTPSEER